MRQPPVGVTGVWLRTAGGEAGPRRLEVLVEVDGKWRLLQSEPTNHFGAISHITEPAGIELAPEDYL
ncbi:MAG: hypothetical protein Q8K32_09250 [Archangium sp.]|nr:hypothetical protein [Archangium sp.]